ncbi:GNAT family N-acetyltransferase [Kribbella yunnanensis]|uniref:GNAT family N-acetyltransferase n=1 Tax=Kribbella yunnanensis TaxID=190194 RepID=A0ABP4V3Z2_9ACTN
MQGEWSLEIQVDRQREEELTDKLVAFNRAAAPIVDVRFEPENLKSEPLQVYAVTTKGTVIGGCVGRVERVWHWLTIDLMWVDREWAGQGVGSGLLAAAEAEGRARGCRWSDVSTFDFQTPEFYRKQGYTEYGVKHDYPPGHSNHFFRKDL